MLKHVFLGLVLVAGPVAAAVNPIDLPHNRNNPIGWVSPPTHIGGTLPGMHYNPPALNLPIKGQPSVIDKRYLQNRPGGYFIPGQPTTNSPPPNIQDLLPKIPYYQVPGWNR